MDEYAFGFTTENTHYGPTRNPHDHERVAGGSSGGSAAAVAAGLVPLTLGSDTNGSIRVPAALCGVFGLKPTYGRVSRRGTALFAGSFDHVGPLARSTRDLAAAFDALQGPDAADPVASRRPAEPARPELGRASPGSASRWRVSTSRAAASPRPSPRWRRSRGRSERAKRWRCPSPTARGPRRW
jgi:Asp-tRNA(Asn)/Glu-tRNA(Gln) amidotransferase A subunit family amidase